MNFESSQSAEEWLPLSRAASYLNVHPTTLRRWADNGDIPIMITPGGHRRFAASDLRQFASQRHGVQRVQNLGQVWADEALSQTRRELVVHRDDSWLAVFDDDARRRHRSLGQQLMGLTLRYLSDDRDDSLLLEAREIGKQYGAIALESAISLSSALQASIFFRDTLVETALHLPENLHVRPGASLRLLRRINNLLNTVHLAIAEVYDAAFADSLPRP